jgi:rod shape-determining protein MreC
VNDVFVPDPKVKIKLLFIVLCSVLLMSFHQRTNYLDGVHSFLTTFTVPFVYIIDSTIELGSYIKTTATSNKLLGRQNKQLREKNLKLSAVLQKYNNLLYENYRLKRLLNTTEKLEHTVVVAKVVKAQQYPFYPTMIIDKGTKHGISTGQTLIDEYGILGQVSQVSYLTSKVILLQNLSHFVSVKVVRNGLRGVINGDGTSEYLKLKFIQNDADIKKGDILISSGLGGKFPIGYPVAKVNNIQKKPGDTFYRITAVPFADINRAQEVMVLFQNKDNSTLRTTK